MKHELKIIMTYEQESIDSDGTSLSAPKIYLDDRIIGLLQNFELRASCQEIIPKVKITFLDYNKVNIDSQYFVKTMNSSPISQEKEIDYYVNKMINVIGIEVKMQDINNGSDFVKVKEIGTDGIIDMIPIKRGYLEF